MFIGEYDYDLDMQVKAEKMNAPLELVLEALKK